MSGQIEISTCVSTETCRRETARRTCVQQKQDELALVNPVVRPTRWELAQSLSLMAMVNLDGASVLGQHFWKALVAVRRFMQTRSAQFNIRAFEHISSLGSVPRAPNSTSPILVPFAFTVRIRSRTLSVSLTVLPGTNPSTFGCENKRPAEAPTPLDATLTKRRGAC